MNFLVFWLYQWAGEGDWVCSGSTRAALVSGWTTTAPLKLVKQAGSLFLVLTLLSWKDKKHPAHTNYNLRILNPAGNRSWRKNILHEISLAVSAKTVFLCGFFFSFLFSSVILYKFWNPQMLIWTWSPAFQVQSLPATTWSACMWLH